MIIFNAILPVFLVIMTGYIVKHRLRLDENFWRLIDRLIFNVLLPLMMIRTLAIAPLSADMLKVGVVVFITVTVLAVACFAFRRFMTVSDPVFSSMFQGTVRVNFYIALSVATILYGEDGIRILSFILLFLIPSSVIYSVLVLNRYGDLPESQAKTRIRSALLKNPIIISTVLGMVLGSAVETIPPVLDETFRLFGQATLPLALMGVGAAISFDNLRPLVRPALAACALRLFIGPALALVLAHYAGLSVQETMCAVIVMSVPSAASSMTFATQMGGDVRVMSAILTTQTFLSIGTLSFFAWYLS